MATCSQLNNEALGESITFLLAICSKVVRVILALGLWFKGIQSTMVGEGHVHSRHMADSLQVKMDCI